MCIFVSLIIKSKTFYVIIKKSYQLLLFKKAINEAKKEGNIQ